MTSGYGCRRKAHSIFFMIFRAIQKWHEDLKKILFGISPEYFFGRKNPEN